MGSGRLIAGKYEVVRALDEGGFGTIFLANQAPMGRPVALKLMNPEHRANRQHQKRFEREAEDLARVTHPNVVSIIDFGEAEEGMLYLVMELVGGSTLSTIMKESAPLPPERAFNIADQVAAGLGAAHAKSIIHRDLKPANILVTSVADRRDFVKIVDFGIALEAQTGDIDQQRTQLTEKGTTLGTPRYMAPEQIRASAKNPKVQKEAKRLLNLRIDVYALGVIFYEMLTGKFPFPLQSDDELPDSLRRMRAHLREQPVPMGHWTHMAPPSLAVNDFLLKTLAKEPERRPQTMQAFRRQMKAAFDAPYEPAPRTATPPTEPTGPAATGPVHTPVLVEGASVEEPATDYAELSPQEGVGPWEPELDLTLDDLGRGRKVAAVIGGLALIAGLAVAIGAWLTRGEEAPPRPPWVGWPDASATSAEGDKTFKASQEGDPKDPALEQALHDRVVLSAWRGLAKEVGAPGDDAAEQGAGGEESLWTRLLADAGSSDAPDLVSLTPYRGPLDDAGRGGGAALLRIRAGGWAALVGRYGAHTEVPSLGLTLAPVLPTARHHGAYVVSVVEEGRADKAGLRRGDIITGLGDGPAGLSPADLKARLSEQGDGAVALARYSRQADEHGAVPVPAKPRRPKRRPPQPGARKSDVPSALTPAPPPRGRRRFRIDRRLDH